MPRQQKQTVEYFSHYCDHKTTMFVLEQKYGNDGYAFWFKLLEMLGKEEGHYLDLRNGMKMEFLQAKTRLDGITTCSILDLLAKLEAIDPELWAKKVVWCENFVAGLRAVYANRRVETPTKPALLHVETTQKVEFYGKESLKEVKEVKEVKRTLHVYTEDFETFWNLYPKSTAKKSAFAEWKKAKATGLLPSIDVILSAIENQKRAKAKAAQTGQFTSEWPDPERWIKKARWEDDPESLIGKTGGNGNGNKHDDTFKRGSQPAYRNTGQRQPAELSADILADIAEANRLAKAQAHDKSAKDPP
ncbi:MAG TPA: Lin1244/Lin1753 domain-containing protein [Dissulfurispiraceae bacterium]|nr:Lin1244/Lin1753 domain-containing protein [Dissulfurispiraceae bacterium]